MEQLSLWKRGRGSSDERRKDTTFNGFCWWRLSSRDSSCYSLVHQQHWWKRWKENSKRVSEERQQDFEVVIQKECGTQTIGKITKAHHLYKEWRCRRHRQKRRRKKCTWFVCKHGRFISNSPSCIPGFTLSFRFTSISSHFVFFISFPYFHFIYREVQEW